MLTKIPLKKKVQVKMVQNSISYKKLNGCICLSPSGVEQRARVPIQIELLIKLQY